MRAIFVHESLSAQRRVVPPTSDERELLAAGRAMRDAIVADLLRIDDVRVTCASGDPDESFDARVEVAAPGAHEDEVAFVRRVAARQDHAWIVAPETDGLLARLHDAVGPARWIGCDGAAIRLASSKRATLERLAARGVPTPLAERRASASAWVVKPDDGAGTLATRRHASLAAARADLDERRVRGEDATVEPWIDGDALSIALLVGADLARPVAYNRQRIKIDRDGWLHDLGVQPAAIEARRDPRVPALRALARQVVHALPGLRGFVGLDVVWQEERGPVLIEVNPRTTCAYVGLSALLGRNLAAAVLRGHATRESLDAAAR